MLTTHDLDLWRETGINWRIKRQDFIVLGTGFCHLLESKDIRWAGFCVHNRFHWGLLQERFDRISFTLWRYGKGYQRDVASSILTSQVERVVRPLSVAFSYGAGLLPPSLMLCSYSVFFRRYGLSFEFLLKGRVFIYISTGYFRQIQEHVFPTARRLHP